MRVSYGVLGVPSGMDHVTYNTVSSSLMSCKFILPDIGFYHFKQLLIS